MNNASGEDASEGGTMPFDDDGEPNEGALQWPKAHLPEPPVPPQEGARLPPNVTTMVGTVSTGTTGWDASMQQRKRKSGDRGQDKKKRKKKKLC